MQTPTRPGAVHIQTDAQVTYNIQLGHSWTPWKDKEIKFPMELVLCPNSSGINGNHQKNSVYKICLGVAPPFFLSLGHVSCLAHLGCIQGVPAHPLTLYN
jgi:hypothetical protein